MAVKEYYKFKNSFNCIIFSNFYCLIDIKMSTVLEYSLLYKEYSNYKQLYYTAYNLFNIVTIFPSCFSDLWFLVPPNLV